MSSDIIPVPAEIVTKMYAKAEKQVAHFENRYNAYGHNDVEPQVTSFMAEYGVRQAYRSGNVLAHINFGFDAPDLTIPALTTVYQQTTECTHEEVKCWKTGNSWNTYGQTVKVHHAEKYERQGRARVWFCEVNRNTNCVKVWGWATPAEILASPIIETSSGQNHHVEVLHRVSEVMDWVVEEKDGWF